MKEQKKQSAPLSRLAELRTRPFAELSQAAKDEYGELNQQRATANAQAIVDNLNRNVMARDR